MLSRTRSLAVAAILAALYVPAHILASQDDAQGPGAGGNASGNRRTNNIYVVQMAELPVVRTAEGPTASRRRRRIQARRSIR